MRVSVEWTDSEAIIFIKGGWVAENGVDCGQAIVFEDCFDEQCVGVREHSNVDAISS
jgi:hypothetical protein